MKGKPRLRISILALALIAMMTALILQLGTLTLAEGEAYATAADARSNKTISTTASRGRILDRNGIPLAYDQTSYNVQFSRDPKKRDWASSALYTEALIAAIKIIEAGGGEVIDTFYMKVNEDGLIEYDFRTDSEETRGLRYKRFCEAMGYSMKDQDQNDPSTWKPATEAYVNLRYAWRIPEDMSFEDAKKIMSIRQEVNLNQWQAYQPVTIAYNVSMEVVAQLDMRANDLPGISTERSTARVYPWGSTAAHIIGYLSRQVSNEMSEPDMLGMGYSLEEFQEYLVKDEEAEDGYKRNKYGNRVVEMTKLGYTNNDYIGVAGVEKTMEKYLTAGTADKRGKVVVETNNSQQIMRELERAPASAGGDVMLTLDLPLQRVTETALQKAIEKIRTYQENLLRDNLSDYAEKRTDVSTISMAATGSIVVLDVNTGKVLSMASYPSYDPNIFMKGPLSEEDIDLLYGEKSNNPTLNRVIASRLAPGSIFKMATGLAGLMEGVITPETAISDGHVHVIDESGHVRPTSETTEEARYTMFIGATEAITNAKDYPKCWTSERKALSNHANLTLSGALAVSCNYYFYTVADAIGINKLNDWSTRLGMNDLTGIELPGELKSHVGGQSVLYDNTVPLGSQKSSLPSYVYKKLKEVLQSIYAYHYERSPDEAAEEAIERCATRILELQDGGDQGFGEDIRRILNEELQIPVTISRGQNWTHTITSLLGELQWKPVMSVRAGIGQATTLLTPIAAARYAAAFANGGTVYDVHIVDRVLDERGSVTKVFEPSVFEKIDAPQEYWETIRRGLEDVISADEGTASSAFTDAFVEDGYMSKIIGKSGTAQISLSANNIDLENTSWFVTMLPRDNPEIVIISCLPNGFNGARAGGPAVEDIVRFYMDRKEGAAKENLVGVNGLIP